MSTWEHGQSCGCHHCRARFGPLPADSPLEPLLIIVAAIVLVVVLLFVARWAYTEYYITTHCTMVLGTRVCQ
jgi:hypothetical protein